MPLSHIKPARVIIDAEGTATIPERARELGIKVEGVLIRDDGWSLGFPMNLKMEAYRLWPSDWVAVITSDGKILKV